MTAMKAAARSVARCVLNMSLFATVPMRRSVRFLGRGVVYLNEKDNRGRWLRSTAGVTQPFVTWMWGKLAKEWGADMAVDVGANYGEVSLSTKYGDSCRIAIVEANPALKPYLERSVKSHVCRDAIRIFPIFAGASGAHVSFAVDEKWSGTSSGAVEVADAPFKGKGVQTSSVVTLRSVALDDALRAFVPAGASRLLVKIDVEGGEFAVLAGMRELFQRFPYKVLIVEHNPVALEAIGVSVRAAVAQYQALGNVFAWADDGTPQRIRSEEDLGEAIRDVVIADRSVPTEEFLSRIRLPRSLRRG
jgi:FkbM family methyltransferase